MKKILFAAGLLAIMQASGQVSLQNGSAYYNIPIYDFSDGRSGLKTSVSLHYSSGNGLIVNDIASNVGQYWDLAAGGSIVRKQNGEPDDAYSKDIWPANPYNYSTHFNSSIALVGDGESYTENYFNYYYPDGFIYNEFPNIEFIDQGPGNEIYAAPRELAFSPLFRNAQDKRWKLSRRALADRQQDEFIYNFNGRTGVFVIGKDGNITLLDQSKLKVTKTEFTFTPTTNFRTKISGFEITDEEGTVYVFNVVDYEKVCRASTIDNPYMANTKLITETAPAWNEPRRDVVNRWQLSEIRNPATGEKIMFQYEYYNLDIIAGRFPTWQRIENSGAQAIAFSERRAKGVFNRISKIILPDGHNVDFTYVTFWNRQDVPQDFPLYSIKLTYNEQTKFDYILTQGYFVKKEIKALSDNIPANDLPFARLCLLSVQKTGEAGIKEPEYKFEYYTGSETSDPADLVPPRNALAQDYWGFYNKAAQLPVDGSGINSSVVQDMMLNHQLYRNPSDGAAKFGLLKSIQVPFKGKTIFEYEQNYSVDADNPTVTKMMGGVRVSKVKLTDDISSNNDVITTYKYIKEDGSTSGWGYEAPQMSLLRQIRVWNAAGANGYRHGGIMGVDATGAAIKGIIRTAVGEISKKAIANSVFNIVNSTFEPQPGPIMGGDVFSQIEILIIMELLDRVFVLFDPTDYIWWQVFNYYPLNSHNQLGMHYSRVEVSNTSYAGGLGKVVYDFSKPADIRAEIPAPAFPFSAKRRYAPSKYDLPEKIKVYNQAGTLIKETINNYNIVNNLVFNDFNKSCKVEAFIMNTTNCEAATYAIEAVSDLRWQLYYPIAGKALLASTTEKRYSPNGVVAESVVQTIYNAEGFPYIQSSVKSNGDEVAVKTYYPMDYDDISPAIVDLKSRNILAVPVSVETWLKKAGNNEYLVDATINEYNAVPNGDIKVVKVHRLQSREPVPLAVIGQQTRTSLIRNTTYFKEQMTYQYNAKGFPVQVTTSGGDVQTTYYDGKNIIARVNAPVNQTAYTSFETSEKGGWAYVESLTTDMAVTGNKHYTFPFKASVSKVILTPGTYTLSLWFKGSTPIVTKGSAIAPDKTIGSSTGWTYYEYTINGTGTLTIKSFAQGGLMDELRLYPKNARMFTTAYDPSFGLITECDANNRLMYYEHDALGRLRLVRDGYRNIVKTFEYNFKQ